jgi:sulfate adenylyltransferase
MFVDWFPEAQQVKAYAEKLRRLDARPVVFVAVAGLTPDSRDEFAKVRTWSKVMARLGFDQASIVVVPVRPRRSPARDALMGAVIASNYGCTHYVWPGGIDSVLFSHEARELASSLGVQVVNALAQPSKNGNGAHNGTVAVSALRDGKRTVLTTFAEIAEDVKAVYPPAHMQGFTVFFTGLPASGKSTLANLLISRLMELDGRHVTLLDGDLVRKHLSSELGFSKEHRDLNITRIGFVASEINKNGGVAICAPIAPFRDARRQARNLVSRWGAFIEVHVSTPVEVCEARDPKGLYAKARAGQIRGFTGVDDPYDVPENPELRIDTSEVSADEGVEAVLQLLRDRGLIRAASQSANGAAHHP